MLTGGHYVKLMEWVSEHRKASVVAVAAVLVIVPAVICVAGHKRDVGTARERLADPKYPVEPLVATLRGLWSIPKDMEPEIEKRLKFEVAALRMPLERATRPEEFRAVDRLLVAIEKLCPALAKPVVGLKTFRAEKEESFEFRALEELVARDRPYAEAARAFAAKYPKSAKLARVQGWQSRAQEQAESKDRGELDQFKIGQRDDVERKLGLVDAFLSKYPHAKDAADLRRAVDLARKLLAATTLKVTLAGAGKFNSAREFSVKVLVDDKQVHEQLSAGSAVEASWNVEVSIPWSPGKPVTLVLYDYTWRNEEAARVHHAGVWSHFALTGRRTLEPADGWEPYFDGKPGVELKTPEFTDEERALLETYLPESADGF